MGMRRLHLQGIPTPCHGAWGCELREGTGWRKEKGILRHIGMRRLQVLWRKRIPMPDRMHGEASYARLKGVTGCVCQEETQIVGMKNLWDKHLNFGIN